MLIVEILMYISIILGISIGIKIINDSFKDS